MLCILERVRVPLPSSRLSSTAGPSRPSAASWYRIWCGSSFPKQPTARKSKTTWRIRTRKPTTAPQITVSVCSDIATLNFAVNTCKNFRPPTSAVSTCPSPPVFLMSRAPHLVTGRAPPPAGPGALLLERPPRRHERGLPRRKAALLRSHYGPGPVLPRQHSSCLHRGKPPGESHTILLHPSARHEYDPGAKPLYIQMHPL